MNHGINWVQLLITVTTPKMIRIHVFKKSVPMHAVNIHIMSFSNDLPKLSKLAPQDVQVIIYYGPKMFTLAGFASSTAIFLSAGISACQMASTLVLSRLVDKVGRKPMSRWGIDWALKCMFKLYSCSVSIDRKKQILRTGGTTKDFLNIPSWFFFSISILIRCITLLESLDVSTEATLDLPSWSSACWGSCGVFGCPRGTKLAGLPSSRVFLSAWHFRSLWDRSFG